MNKCGEQEHSNKEWESPQEWSPNVNGTSPGNRECFLNGQVRGEVGRSNGPEWDQYWISNNDVSRMSVMVIWFNNTLCHYHANNNICCHYVIIIDFLRLFPISFGWPSFDVIFRCLTSRHFISITLLSHQSLPSLISVINKFPSITITNWISIIVKWIDHQQQIP